MCRAVKKLFPSNQPALNRQAEKAAKLLDSDIHVRVHAVQRMFERRISMRKVRAAIESGEMIEDYSLEMPEPSQLILGFQGKRPFHVVTSENSSIHQITIITVYNPDPAKWSRDFRRRK